MQSSENPKGSPGQGLKDFVEDILGDENLRIEEDFGSGFVRLRSSEAERRQAAQDIRSTEDVVIELLRNARDAGSKSIFLATQKDGSLRRLVMVDDGEGIPKDMQERVFLPRVTSKLDTAHLDHWGMHGRGMALYSISVNAQVAEVQTSMPGLGSSIKVVTDTKVLSEKSDQSAFPRFEKTQDTFSMRGPKNILRTCAEFSLQHKDQVSVFVGSPTEVISTMYHLGVQTIPASRRLFNHASDEELPLPLMLGLANTPEELAELASVLGLDVSVRSARRVLDGEIPPLPSMLHRIATESFGSGGETPDSASRQNDDAPRKPHARISKEDLASFTEAVSKAFSELSQKYYLEEPEPKVFQRGGRLVAEFDIIDQD